MFSEAWERSSRCRAGRDDRLAGGFGGAGSPRRRLPRVNPAASAGVHLRAERRDDGGLTPRPTAQAFEFSRILKPLEAFREDTLVLSGLAHRNGAALGDGPGDHARAAASYLTGVHPRKTAGADIQNGISVDQIAAQHLAGQTRFPSLELGCDDSRTVGNCDSGYSCAYTNSLAWRGPATPMPPETNPRLSRAAVR
jgi:hypothetical protein